MKPTQTKTDLDILWGAAAIGAAISINRRKAFYLLEGGFIPGMPRRSRTPKVKTLSRVCT